MEEFAAELIYTLVLGVLLIVPGWRIFRRAGLAPSLSLVIFVPYLGLLIVTLILAFRRWPATEGVTTPHLQRKG